MEPLKQRGRGNPELIIRKRIVKMLEGRGWITKVIHGGLYQSGLPDLFCCHKRFGMRWVEIKLPDMYGSSFTKDQNKWFPILSSNGCPIWILTSDTEAEYKKLFEPENWFSYFLQKM